MAILLDDWASGIASTPGNTTVSASVTVGGNSDRLLVALLACFQSTGAATFSGVSGGGGGTWTRIEQNSVVGRAVEVWYSTNPDPGSQTVTATMSAPLFSSSDAFIGLFSLAQVKTADPWSDHVSSVNASSITVASDSFAVAVIGFTAILGVPTGCTTTNDRTESSANHWFATTHCTGSPNMTFTWGSHSAVIAALGLNEQPSGTAQDVLHVGVTA